MMDGSVGTESRAAASLAHVARTVVTKTPLNRNIAAKQSATRLRPAFSLTTAEHCLGF
jgi:hypothetical protein